MEQTKRLDIGCGDLYIGPPYRIPYFFETRAHRMMKDEGNFVSFRTWKGEYFQFYLDKYHGKNVLVLTSTLKDSVFIFPKNLSLEESFLRFEKAYNNKIPVKGSYTGYYCYGGEMVKLYGILNQHLKEQEIFFSKDVITEVYNELRRREKHE